MRTPNPALYTLPPPPLNPTSATQAARINSLLDENLALDARAGEQSAALISADAARAGAALQVIEQDKSTDFCGN